MLRLLFATSLILFGAVQSLRGPFYALLFYLGFAYFRPETWIWGDQLQGLNLSLLIGAGTVAATLLSTRERLSWTMPVCLIVAFCLHGLVSTLLSGHVEWSMTWWQGFAKVAVMTILIIGVVNTEERFRLTLLVIVFALGFESVKQGWYYVLFNQSGVNLNPVEVLGDNNGVAVGMLMLSAILLSLMQTSEGWQKKVFGFMLVGSTFRAISTYSRGGLLAFIAMVAVYWTRSTRKVQTAALIGVVTVGLFSLLPTAYWQRMDTITSGDDGRDASSEGRLFFWKVAVAMANENPILGVGPNGFQAAFDEHDPSHGAYGHDRAVHSMWFGVLADQGYVGLVLFAALIALALRATARVRRMTRRTPEHAQLFAFAGAMQAALVSVIVGGTFLSFHYVEILWHFLGLSFALEAIATRAQATSDAVNRDHRLSIARAYAPAGRPAHVAT